MVEALQHTWWAGKTPVIKNLHSAIWQAYSSNDTALAGVFCAFQIHKSKLQAYSMLLTSSARWLKRCDAPGGPGQTPVMENLHSAIWQASSTNDTELAAGSYAFQTKKPE